MTAPSQPQASAVAWLRAISTWLLETDNDMVLPNGILDTDPLSAGGQRMTRPRAERPGREPAITPIELPDDGLRVTRAGQVRGYPLVCLHNPALIAEIAAAKAIRRSIRDANERMFT